MVTENFDFVQVEVTVLEVEMADDCVSTSALRFISSSNDNPQIPSKPFKLSINCEVQLKPIF